MDLSIRFLILVLLGLVLGGSAEASLNADDLLNQLEDNLLELVNQVQDNALNSCHLLSTCNAESTCSRLSCPLTHANTAGYECQRVLQNTNCEGNCPWRNFDFSRSFLSVPGVKAVTDDYITQRQLQEICAQRNLDSFFQSYSNNTNFFSLYFGSVDGTCRFFPGMEESDCGSYDPRTRLWYLTATTNVKKAVMVLIDSGSSMTKIIPSTRSDSNLATALSKVIILITDNNAADAISNAALPWDLIKNNSINVFLYMFNTSNAATDYTSLASQLCVARGYFKILNDIVVQNPLLALEAYYSFVANVHLTYVNSGIDYTIEHSDYSEVDDRTFTLSKAVFSSNRELLEVAGIDIFKTKVQEVYGISEDDITSVVGGKRNQSNTINAPAGVNTSSNKLCNLTLKASNIVCPSNFDTNITTLQELSCCNCTGADKPRNLPLALGLGLGLGIPTLVTLAVIAWFCLRNRHPIPHVFSGDDDDGVR